MTLNIAAFVNSGLAIAQRLGVAGSVTITRDVAAVVAPSSDESLGVIASSFTVPNAGIETIDSDTPATDTSAPNKARRLTLPAIACAFVPAYGMTALLAGQKLRVLKCDPIAPNGVDAVAYLVEVAR